MDWSHYIKTDLYINLLLMESSDPSDEQATLSLLLRTKVAQLLIAFFYRPDSNTVKRYHSSSSPVESLAVALLLHEYSLPSINDSTRQIDIETNCGQRAITKIKLLTASLLVPSKMSRQAPRNDSTAPAQSDDLQLSYNIKRFIATRSAVVLLVVVRGSQLTVVAA